MKLKHNSTLQTKILSFTITFLVIFLLLIAGPVNALTLALGSKASTVAKGTNVEFTADIDINSTETLSINEIILELSGPELVTCKFSSQGDIISGCKGISISRISAPHFGYGYGYNFGYGYGYGYTNGKLQYKIILDTSNYKEGIYSTALNVKIENSSFSKAGNSLTINSPVQTSQNANSNTNSNNEDNKGCSTKWVCSDWSACDEGTQTRTCEKEIRYCAAPRIPETSRSCTITENLASNNLEEEKDIEDYELSQDEVKDIYQNQGFFPTITGAVIGAVNNHFALGAIIFFILIIGLSIIISIIRRR